MDSDSEMRIGIPNAKQSFKITILNLHNIYLINFLSDDDNNNDQQDFSQMEYIRQFTRLCENGSKAYTSFAFIQ